MPLERKTVEKQIGRHTLKIETGVLGKQAAGCVLVTLGETTVLSAAATDNPRPGIDFFPLTCDYRERYAAAGKFPGGFLKREGRPTTKETLTARLIDRPIRPMFAEGFKNEVQIQNFVLSSDRQVDGDVLAMNGASAALAISPMPFMGPLGSVRMGKVDGKLVAFPTAEELEFSTLDLIISGTKDAILMIEGFAREMPEDEMIEALLEAHKVVGELCDLQNELVEIVKPEKMEWVPPASDGLFEKLDGAYHDKLKAAKQTEGKQARAEAVGAVKKEALAEFIPDPDADGAFSTDSFGHAFHDLEAKVVRETILEGKRPDGRGGKDLRNLYSEVDLLPLVHGSAMFQRGETQAMITVTLGTGRDEQRVDGLLEEYSKRFMLDYNFPSFSVGECRPIRGPGRREIGHGMLAERSVNPILPDHDEFPYTIRVISDILESNGSSSMASVCGATLGLMAAGVPISNPVAGISVGLVKEGDDFTLLTDILGDEDHFGDMDFKIAGTQNGITGIQLDLKIMGISEEIIRATL
ncbi:MAG: polyribonucleotide nucleotidyltransferase, partial [Planctomycetota bacterium]